MPDLHTEPIGTDCLCAVLAPAHPLAQQAALTLQQLVGGPLLLREPGSTAREVLEHACAEQGLALHPAWESVSTAALVQAAAQQLGVAILPEQLAAADAVLLQLLGQKMLAPALCVPAPSGTPP